MTESDLIGTWRFHSDLTLKLLDWVPEDGLVVTGEIGGRAVAVQFAHIHTARRMWLEAAAPDLLTDVDKIPTRSKADKAAITKERLHRQLTISANAIEKLLARSLASGSVKNFKGSAVRFLGYLIAHESYHWAEIGIILSESGLPLDKGKQHQLWQWW